MSYYLPSSKSCYLYMCLALLCGLKFLTGWRLLQLISSRLLFFKNSCQTQLCTKLIKVYSTTHIGLARIKCRSRFQGDDLSIPSFFCQNVYKPIAAKSIGVIVVLLVQNGLYSTFREKFANFNEIYNDCKRTQEWLDHWEWDLCNTCEYLK